MKKSIVTICSMLAGMAMMAQSVTTERLYLSGKGCDLSLIHISEPTRLL